MSALLSPPTYDTSSPEQDRASRSRKTRTTSVPSPRGQDLLASSPRLGSASPRATSPATRPSHSRPPSPARSINSIFERDVELPSDHFFSPQEATDIAIAPSLQEAANLLTTEEVPSDEIIDQIIRTASSAGLNSTSASATGWHSPLTDSLTQQTSYHSPSPQRSFQSFSPVRPGTYSPTFSSSPPESSVLTPSTSPSPPPSFGHQNKPYYSESHPHLRQFRTASPPMFALSDNAFSTRSGSTSPPESNSPLSISPPRTSAFGVLGRLKEPRIAGENSLPPSPANDSFDQTDIDAKQYRRLSFMSYADLIHDERAHQPDNAAMPTSTASSPRPRSSMDLKTLWSSLPDS